MSGPIPFLATHTVTNQPPSLFGYNAYTSDVALQALMPPDIDPALQKSAESFGQAVGDEYWISQGFAANHHVPELHNFDRCGHRIDEVDFHPAYHELMTLGMRHGVHSVELTAPANGHSLHVVLQHLLTQLEPGTCCPLAMTYAAVPVLQHCLPQDSTFLRKATVARYDQRFIPAPDKQSLTLGMAMTEKQGGSDIRANTTTATPDVGSNDSDSYRLRGHKWFCSAPMSDAFLTLAQTEEGLTCFLVPRFCPDGSRNRILIQRLKNKLGNRANASSEIEYDDTWALRLGDEGAGVSTIMDMVQHTRLDAAAAPAGMMRQALVQAIHHTRHRQAFGKPLSSQPLMQNVLADLALESEAATLLVMRVARAFDAAEGDNQEKLFARLATVIAKFWINKQAPQFIYEAMECHGGAGYIEESMLPRLYREAPVNSIWEGSGNIICLDFVRVLQNSPECLDAFNAVVRDTVQSDVALRKHHHETMRILQNSGRVPALARRCLASLAVLLQAVLMMEYSDNTSATQFLASRLGVDQYQCYGALDCAQSGFIIDRAWPL